MTITPATVRQHRQALSTMMLPEPGPVWEIHALHSLPASNPNRDRFNRPKEQTFGSARRARISSQSLKRAAREQMRDTLAGEVFGVRTRNVTAIVAEHLTHSSRNVTAIVAEHLTHSSRLPHEWDDATIKALAAAAARQAFWPKRDAEPVAADNDDGEAGGDTILFVSDAELEHVANVLIQLPAAVTITTSKGNPSVALGSEIKQRLAEPFPDALQPIEAALTGRFFAQRPNATVEAAVQVAHTLSIHRLISETDYFSAVEEHPVTADSGAAHAGDADFNSSCHYKYARIDVPQLALNLDPGDPVAQIDRARTIACAFTAAFIDAVPAAKQATMNASTPASYALLVRRRRGGWNLANAFIKPVLSRTDLVGEGIKALDEHLGKVLTTVGDADLIAIDIARDTLDSTSAGLAPVASTWTPGSHGGQLVTLLDRLRGAA